MNDLKQQLAPGWSAVNIGITVFLFITAWPIGLAMIAYILWGQKFGLDLGRPATLSAFAKRLGVAWRAAVDAFNNSSSTN